MYGIVYCTINKINNKKYIGQHKCKNENDSYLGSGKTLKKAIKKYGRENFTRITLFKAETEEELDRKEIEFISAFRAAERNDYYNIAEGGLTQRRMLGENNPSFGKSGKLSPVYGRKHTQEELKRMSDSQKGKTIVFTEETRRKMSEIKKRCGAKPCPLAYERLKGKPGCINAGRKHKHVLCVELGIVYESQSEIERVLKIPQANIHKVLHGIREKAGGYHFTLTESEVGPYDSKNGCNN